MLSRKVVGSCCHSLQRCVEDDISHIIVSFLILQEIGLLFLCRGRLTVEQYLEENPARRDERSKDTIIIRRIIIRRIILRTNFQSRKQPKIAYTTYLFNSNIKSKVRQNSNKHQQQQQQHVEIFSSNIYKD
jgi:hypothetical protein